MNVCKVNAWRDTKRIYISGNESIGKRLLKVGFIFDILICKRKTVIWAIKS